MKMESDLQRLLCRKFVKLIVAFFAPILIVTLVYNGLNIYPYESMTVLTSDLNNQYVSYYAYLKDTILSGNGLFYTFSKTIGGDMYGLAGYYLLSPINILLLFCSKETLPFMIMIITMIKIGLSSLFMFMYLSEKRGYAYKNLIFASAYALNGYMVAFVFNLMWLDAVYLLPLVILGVERIFKNKNSILYIFTLGLSIISCYYTGYMVCIFTGIYGVYYFFTKKNKMGIKVKNFVRFGLASLVGAGISTVVLLPSLVSLSGSKEVGAGMEIGLDMNFSPVEFLTKFFTGGSIEAAGYSDLPNIYFGMVVFVFLIGFFVNKKIKLGDKIGTAVVLLILFASMLFKTTDMIWHGFAEPNMFYFRYSFVFSFMAIITAEKAYHRMNGLQKIWQQLFMAFVALGLMAISALYVGEDTNIKFVLLDAVVVVLTVIIISKYYKTDRVLIPVLTTGLLIATMVSLYINTNTIFSKMEFVDNSITGFAKEMEPCVDYIENKDNTFYRVEKNFYYSHNDPMFMSYKGLSHFSSTEKAEVKNFMRDMGYMAYYEYWSHYGNGSTIGADSLLGVKYVMSRTDIGYKYKLIGQSEDVFIYENEYALPIVFASSKDIMDYDNKEENLFKKQNEIYSSIVGDLEDVYTEIKVTDKILENVEESLEGYKKINSAADGAVHYLVEATDSNIMYMYMGTNGSMSVTVYVNGVKVANNFDSFGNGIITLGAFDTGNIIDVKIELDSNTASFYEPYVFVENVEMLKANTDIIKRYSADVKNITDSHVEATIVTVDNQIIMTTIPYDENWKVTVDGQEKDAIELLGTMMGIEVDAGTHTITFEYAPPYFYESLLVSCSCVLILIAVIVYNRVKCKSAGKDKKNEIQSV